MTDRRFREAERRWLASGSAEDQAAFLQERVRVGDLDADRLALAAHTGHVGASLARGRSASDMEMFRWVEGFQAWGREAFVRAALAPVEMLPPHISAEAVRVVRDWLALDSEGRARFESSYAGGSDHASANAARYLNNTIWNPETRSAARDAATSCVYACDALGEGTVRKAVREAIATWALRSERPFAGSAVRFEEIDKDRLRLAAFIGDPGAYRFLGDEAPDPPEDDKAWLQGLSFLWPAAHARVLQALGSSPSDQPSGRLRQTVRRTLLPWIYGEGA